VTKRTPYCLFCGEDRRPWFEDGYCNFVCHDLVKKSLNPPMRWDKAYAIEEKRRKPMTPEERQDDDVSSMAELRKFLAAEPLITAAFRRRSMNILDTAKRLCPTWFDGPRGLRGARSRLEVWEDKEAVREAKRNRKKEIIRGKAAIAIVEALGMEFTDD
jgi:hypothetical protein